MADKPKVKLSDDEILELLQPDIDKAVSIQDDLSSQREDYYKRFRGDTYGNEREGWSQSVAPIIWTSHQSRTSSLIEIFSDEFFTLKSDNADRATKFQKLIRYQMFRKQDGYKRLYDFLYNAGIYHYAIFKVYKKDDYDLQYQNFDRLTAEQMMMLTQDPNVTVSKYTETVLEGDPLMGMPDTTVYDKVKAAKKVVTYSGPAFEVVPNWEFYYSPDCKLGDWGSIDGRLVYHQVKRDLNYIRKRERAGIYRKGTYDQCLDLATSDNEYEVDEQTVKFGIDEVSEQTEQTEREGDLDKHLTKQVSVKECYCKLDIDGDGLLEPCIVTIIEDEVIAQVEENPYKRPCFRIGGMLPEPHKINGIAPPEKLDNDQKIMTNLVRFVQDMAAMSVYRNVVTNDARLQQMLQVRKPFDVLLGDPQKLGEVPVQAADPFILKAIELLKSDIEESTGDTRYNQGMDSESLNKTATGISLISQASARRLRMSAKLMGNGAISGVLRDFIFINQKWKSQDPIKLLGTDIVVNPEDLDGEYDIEIDIGVSPAEKQAMANQIDMFVQFATQFGIPSGIMQPIHVIKAQKKKYGLLNINIDDLMLTEQQFMQMQEQAKQNPPQEDWKEYLQIDKIWEFLPPEIQAQIMSRILKLPLDPKMFIQQPSVDSVMNMKEKQMDIQGKMAIEAQKHGYEKEKHKMETTHKMIDHYTTLKEAENKGVVRAE